MGKKIGNRNMILQLRHFWIFIGFLFVIGTTTAQVSFEAKVSKKKLGINERLRVDFVMNKNGDDFTPPEFPNFELVGGPNQALSNVYDNGKRRFSKTISYFLSPKRKGTLSIGQATVKIDGQIYKTTPVNVTVTSAVKKPNDPNNVDYIVDENLHLVAEVSKGRPFLNEAITVVYKLYFRSPINISDVREMESPTFSDFWNHQIQIDQIRATSSTYKGESYNEVIWRKVVLYPQKTGKLTLEPLTLNLSVGVPSKRRDIFGGRIYQQVQKIVTAGQRTINVKALPEKGKPVGFTGAVGVFDFDVILNKDALKASESFQAKVKVTGKGNLKLFNLPELSTPNTLEVYEPEHTENVRTSLAGMQGSIEDVYTVVPQYQGKYPIPPISFSYFNPKTQQYKTLQSQDLIVNVFEGPTASKGESPPSGLIKQRVTTNDGNFRFINLNTDLQPIKKKDFWLSRLFHILLLIPFVLLLFFILLKKFVFGQKQDVTTLRQRRAKQLARRYLSSAKKALGKEGQFYQALERALHNYLKAKLHIETTEFSKQKIKDLLTEKQIPIADAKAFVKLLENCEMARYAPKSEVTMNADLKEASTIISIIDKQL